MGASRAERARTALPQREVPARSQRKASSAPGRNRSPTHSSGRRHSWASRRSPSRSRIRRDQWPVRVFPPPARKLYATTRREPIPDPSPGSGLELVDDEVEQLGGATPEVAEHVLGREPLGDGILLPLLRHCDDPGGARRQADDAVQDGACGRVRGRIGLSQVPQDDVDENGIEVLSEERRLGAAHPAVLESVKQLLRQGLVRRTAHAKQCRTPRASKPMSDDVEFRFSRGDLVSEDAGPPAAPDPVAATPVGESERLVTLDVLRGFALLGVCVVNMQFFTMPFAAALHDESLAQASWASQLSWGVMKVFFESKSISLFSLLFGMGLVLQMMRAEAAGRAFVPLYLRRSAVLFLIGAVHALFFWYGDILLIYSLIGLWLLLLRRWSPRSLLIAAAGCMVVGTLLFLLTVAGGILTESMNEDEPVADGAAAEGAAAPGEDAEADEEAATEEDADPDEDTVP